MLRTTCKQALNNIHNYIMENTTAENCGYNVSLSGKPFSEYAKELYRIFYSEVGHYYTRSLRYSEQEAFKSWCQGLPSAIDTCYYYNRSAVEDVAKILQESDTEKMKYTEEEAENLLTWLIYREIKKVVDKK